MSRPGLRRLRRWLYVILAVVFCLFVLWPTVAGLMIRHRMASALQRAENVRLEEFRGSQVITSVELPREEWRQVLAAVPVVPDAGAPFMVALCFIPHHRVVVMDAADGRFDFTVCFGCDQVATKSSGILGTPYLWRAPVRRLFTQHKIPIRTSREYVSLRPTNNPVA